MENDLPARTRVETRFKGRREQGEDHGKKREQKKVSLDVTNTRVV